MRLDDYRESDNVEEQQAGGGSGLGGFGGGRGGGGLGLIFGLVASRFGIVGIIVLVGGMLLLGLNPFAGGGGQQQVARQQAPVSHQQAQSICNANAQRTFSCRVLASTEDTWARLFQTAGSRYVPPRLDFYSGRGSSGCGAAMSAMGPFYCPTDQKVYLDTSFFDELANRFHAAGDFAEAYVIAHEVGHHVQYLTGIAAKVRAGQQQSGEAAGNALQVKMELQADCYAGVWAANNRDRLEPGDVEEGLRAASAIGDDTLQKAAGQTPVPDSFTHGTSAQRVHWLKRGLDTGDPQQCDTFSEDIGAE